MSKHNLFSLILGALIAMINSELGFKIDSLSWWLIMIIGAIVFNLIYSSLK